MPRTSSIHAIGSTPFGEPTNVDNPGPGTYDYPSSVSVKKVGKSGGFGAGLGIGGAKGDSGSSTTMNRQGRTHQQQQQHSGSNGNSSGGGASSNNSSHVSSRKGRLLVAPEWNAPSVPTTLSKGPFAHPEG